MALRAGQKGGKKRKVNDYQAILTTVEQELEILLKYDIEVLARVDHVTVREFMIDDVRDVAQIMTCRGVDMHPVLQRFCPYSLNGDSAYADRVEVYVNGSINMWWHMSETDQHYLLKLRRKDRHYGESEE